MKECTILNVNEISDAISMTTGVDGFLYARQELLGPNIWFYHEGIAVQFQILGNFKCIVHLFGVSRDKLKNLRDFLLGSFQYVMDKGYSCILVFCKVSDLKLRFLLRAGGQTEGTLIKDANGEEDEILYVYSKSERATYEENIRCHKQL